MEQRQAKRPVIEDRYSNSGPRLSPDHRWLAFEMQNDVFVTAFSTLEGRRQISTDGGTDPIWAPDGRTLFYRRWNSVMAVPIRTAPVLETGRALVLAVMVGPPGWKTLPKW